VKPTSIEETAATPADTAGETTTPTAKAAGPTKVEKQEETETPAEAMASICFVLVIGLFLMGFVFQNFEIPSGSMKNTLLVGDHVVVDRTTLAPATKWAPFVHYRPVQRGDVIVFLKPNPESPDLILVKRAIAVAGDRLHLKNGVVYLNGVAQNEPYAIQPGSPESDHMTDPYRDEFPSRPASESTNQMPEVWQQDLPTHIQNGDLVVPPGHVFAMGDNRTGSLDSRYWGFVPVENIMGRPLFVYWSFKTPDDQENKTSMGDRVGFFVHVITHFLTETRWSRTFHAIR
jgi:signal peptidase I